MSVVNSGLSSSWCGTETTTDDTADSLGNAYTVKVIYAYAADQPDNFAAYKDLIQNTVRNDSLLVEQAANNTRSVRYDVGTSCGPQYVDIQTVQLPHDLSYYTSSESALSTRFFTDMRTALGITSASQGTRNYLVFADRLGEIGDGYQAPGGQGQILGDSEPSGNNPLSNGGRIAVLYGRGESDFFYDSWGVLYTYTAALHETLHTLGAVQNDSPHTSGGWHCNDGQDIMCYADGGSASNYTTSSCSQEVVDCGKDDYFAPSPAGGSYLASHWNVYNSPFLCALAYCDTPSQPPAVSASYAPATAGNPVTVTASASDPDGPGPLTYLWDLDGVDGFERNTGAANSVTFTPSYDGQVIHLRVVDAAGAFADKDLTVNSSPQQNQQQTANQPPAATISTTAKLTAVAQGTQMTFSGQGSRDPDGQIVSYAWSVDGQPAGSSAQLTKAFDRVGAHRVALTVTDNAGATGSTQVAVQVISSHANQPPKVKLTASSRSPRAGQQVRLTALASDPDGSITGLRWRLPGRKTFSAGRRIRVRLKAGSQTITVIATDNDGASAQASIPLKVRRR